MALETKPAKDPAAEDKHELDPKRKAALDIAKGMQKEHIASDVIAKITGLTLAEIENL